VAACSVAWWYWPRKTDAKPGVATARVVRRNLASMVLATGAVKPQVGAEVRLGARISGKVERLHANIGDLVKMGQVMAELEKADLEAQVRQRTAEFNMAEADGPEIGGRSIVQECAAERGERYRDGLLGDGEAWR
jgi:multidrug efflux pump subunit AcrA (membrane-fusion protein)